MIMDMYKARLGSNDVDCLYVQRKRITNKDGCANSTVKGLPLYTYNTERILIETKQQWIYDKERFRDTEKEIKKISTSSKWSIQKIRKMTEENQFDMSAKSKTEKKKK